jgi:hypothetical protein
MSLDAPVIHLAGLIEIELPLKTVRLCDGGWLDWPGHGRFVSSDPDYGTISAVEAPQESISDEAATARLTLLPPSVTKASALFQPQASGASVRAWDVEYDPATNQVVGEPDKIFEALIDMLTPVNDRGQRSLVIELADAAQRLWLIKEGNVLSPAWHKRIWPGETGLDHATGSPVAVPWGITGPARGSIGIGSTVGGGVGGGGSDFGPRLSLNQGIG